MSDVQFNLARDQLFPLRIQGERQWLALSQAATLGKPSRIDHPVAALNTPLMMLLTAMVQYQQDRQGGITSKEIRNVIRGTSPAPFDWVNGDISDAGFNLFGDDAYLQIPQPWVDSSGVTASGVQGLYRPLRTDGGKALRLADHKVKAVCPACAAIGLFFKNQFMAPMSQYWGSSAAAGHLVVIHMAVDGRGYDLPTSVAMNLMADWPSDKLKHGKAAKADNLPWVGGEASLVKAICAPADEKLSRSASLMPLIRAQRLCEPQGTGTCDCCARADMPLVSSYYEIGEKTLFAGLEDNIKGKIAQAAALSGAPADDAEGVGGGKGAPYIGVKMLANMYESAATRRHPNVPYRDNKDGERLPVIHAETYEDATQSLPTWVCLQDVLGPDSMPLKKNLFGDVTGALGPVVNRRIAHLFYTIVPENRANPNPKFIADESYSLLYTEDSLRHTEEVSAMAKEIVQGTREVIDILMRSAAMLFKDVKIGVDKIGLKSDSRKGMNPYGNAKRLPSIRSAAATLWDDAFLLLNEAAAEAREHAGDDSESGAEIARRKVAQLEASAREAWKKIEDIEFGSPDGARDLYLQARATREFHILMKKRAGATVPETATEEA